MEGARRQMTANDSRAGKREGRRREEKRGKSVSVAVERAAVNETRRWEYDSESERGGNGESSGSEVETTVVPVAKREQIQQKGKLVDV